MAAARLIHRKREELSDDAFTETVVWEVSTPVPGSTHSYKYRLAFVMGGEAVLRFDNERGKGDHKHIGSVEIPYTFRDVPTPLSDFKGEVARWLAR